MDASQCNNNTPGGAPSCQEEHSCSKHSKFVSSSSAVRIKQGKTLVIIGTVVCLAGIAIYCLSLVSNDFGQSETVFLKSGLVVIAAGFVAWMIGAVKYINGAIDSNSSDEIF